MFMEKKKTIFERIKAFFVRSSKPSKEEILQVLDKIHKENPYELGDLSLKEQFRKMIPELHKYDEALTYLEEDKYLRQQYFSALKDTPDIGFQRKLCAMSYVSEWGCWTVKYRNLLRLYLSRWDLLPKIKETVFEDSRCEEIVRIYKQLRK